ncbi:MAG: peptidase [Cyanobacteria bacterium RYN_339]|nr:peptidase [Cyanobacteria bacterium RYN_339]
MLAALIALSLFTQPAPAKVPTGDEAFAKALQDALGSGEWSHVAPLFPAKGDPALAFLQRRWHDVRAGKLDPVAWDVKFTPFYHLGQRLGGRLSLAAREANGQRAEGRFNLEIVPRGASWVAGEPIDVDHGEVRVTAHNLAVDLRNGKLAASDTLTLEAQGPDRRVFLRLAPGLKVAGATAGDQPWAVVQTDELIYFQAPDAGPVTLAYTGDLPVQAPAGLLILPARAGWYPQPADGAFATFQLTAVLPPGMEASAAGEPHAVEREADRWTFLWTADAAIAGESLFAGPLERMEGEKGEPRLAALVPPENKGVGVDLLESGRATAAFYTTHYGAPATHHLAVVLLEAHPELASPAAIPMPHAALISPALAHEVLARGLAQAWVANVRYEGTPFERRFMTQGVGAYMAQLYQAKLGGPKAFRQGLAEAQAVIWEGLMTPDDTPREPGMTPDQVDARAILVLHMLRRQVGNAAFDQALRGLYAQRGEAVTLTRFRKAFEIASGKVLEPFFDQWLGHAGIPGFELENIEVTAKGKDLYEITGEVVQQAPAYFLGLPMVVSTAKGQVLYEVPVRAQRTGFKLVARSKPTKLFVDPLHDVLATPVEPIDLTAPAQ